MEITVRQQILWFGAAVLMGAGMGMLSQVNNVLQAALGIRKWMSFLLDILFFTVCGIASFLFMVVFLEGNIRIYPWVGMGIGASVVYCTVGNAGRKTVRWIYRRRMKSRISAAPSMMRLFLGKKTKKT